MCNNTYGFTPIGSKKVMIKGVQYEVKRPNALTFEIIKHIDTNQLTKTIGAEDFKIEKRDFLYYHFKTLKGTYKISDSGIIETGMTARFLEGGPKEVRGIYNIPDAFPEKKKGFFSFLEKKVFSPSISQNQ